jgi:hypothetical protein
MPPMHYSDRLSDSIASQHVFQAVLSAAPDNSMPAFRGVFQLRLRGPFRLPHLTRRATK